MYSEQKRKYGRFNDLTSKQFGRLTVLNREPNIKDRLVWKCQCDCGVVRVIRGESLRTGRTVSCGCYHKQQIKRRPFEWLFKILKRSAKHMNHSCDLTYEQFCEFTKIENCHYCNDKIIWQSHETKNCGYAYYLDRKNNSQGYSQDNCVVCCTECNRVKGNKYDYTNMISIGKVLCNIKS